MKKNGLWGGLIWLIGGIGLCIASSNASLGDLRAPGTGFLPFIIGALLALFGSILMIQSVMKNPVGRDHPERKNGFTNWRKFLFPSLAVVILLAYVLLLESVGYLLTTFLCLLALFKLSEPEKWLIPIAASGGVVIVSYIILVVWLRNPFPKGILGF